MSWQLVAAGLLAALGAAWHGAGGERTILRDLRASQTPPLSKVLLRTVWHLLTLTLSATAIWLLASGIAGPGTLGGERFIAALYAGYALVALVVAAYRGALLKIPQWLLLGAIAALTWWGAV